MTSVSEIFTSAKAAYNARFSNFIARAFDDLDETNWTPREARMIRGLGGYSGRHRTLPFSDAKAGTEFHNGILALAKWLQKQCAERPRLQLTAMSILSERDETSSAHPELKLCSFNDQARKYFGYVNENYLGKLSLNFGPELHPAGGEIVKMGAKAIGWTTQELPPVECIEGQGCRFGWFGSDTECVNFARIGVDMPALVKLASWFCDVPSDCELTLPTSTSADELPGEMKCPGRAFELYSALSFSNMVFARQEGSWARKQILGRLRDGLPPRSSAPDSAEILAFWARYHSARGNPDALAIPLGECFPFALNEKHAAANSAQFGGAPEGNVVPFSVAPVKRHGDRGS